MDHYEYIQLPFDTTPQDIIDEYNLTYISNNEKSHIKIRKGMYGLPQYGVIAHDRLKITCKSTDRNLLNLPQDSGHQNPDPSTSPSLMMTLESSMLEIHTQRISYNYFKSYTKPKSVGKGNYFFHSPSSGTTRKYI